MLNHVGDKFGRNRLTAFCFAILTRVSEIRHDKIDPICRCSSQGVNHDQKLHEVIIHRLACRLDDKHIVSAHAFIDGKTDFSICKVKMMNFRKMDSKLLADLFSKLGMSGAGQYNDTFFTRQHYLTSVFF